MDFTADQRHILLQTARQTICSALGAPSIAPVEISDDPLLQIPAGCFVTLHTLSAHRLRGCIGRLDCDFPLIDSVRHAAASVLNDPRFEGYRVSLHDLPDLELEITVILPMEPAANCLDFELLTDGIYLTFNNRTGCFLPQVARETGWTREQLLSRLCTEKLGVSADSWQLPSAKLMKFRTILIGPEPFELRQPIAPLRV